jgi:hypothetical protein
MGGIGSFPPFRLSYDPYDPYAARALDPIG